MRKLALLSAAIFIALSAMGPSTPVQAQDLAWCSKIKGMLNCMYETRSQCRASVSGRQGTCVQNRRR
ncbi:MULTISPECIES: DUF3551 domain-containing protein [Bradyrhizobium]|uniref:DUF3551 domain-containing protein n=1 Tax=Bradyrhizobium TaxID=374 RepID=UPI001260D717|nr:MULTISPECIES: DUF3551 domain-containing protein [Bradyrhizobium]MBR1329390.1 DUF3551 domain-containing protein [Bradyrhizobium ottawaense]MBR1335629.1 DUF3551 domain-containing protein [Bradyrhizobium ottawaense]MBR1363146.1 DUF3551 domain-containing protein [Bradyrhizobium ottawaense]MDA9459176.1 hypothetical protein [Bradyrhizobium sp. CCBAU 21359]MDA9478790.1 hypothetical protein [Bradyrhizobium sp. CCBAU 65884]